MKIIRPKLIRETGGTSFTRSSTATYRDKDGVMQTAGTNVPRVNFQYNLDKGAWEVQGVLLENAATNILLNSTTLSTQSVTTATQNYTLSFYGTGTVVLSGAHSATVVGTHASVKTTYTFASAGGSLTLTVTGTVSYAQLETGTKATSWISTAGSTATRTADVIAGSSYIYSNVPQTEHATWSALTAYNVGDRVIFASGITPAIFERVVAGTTATDPASDAVNWIKVGPTNRWAAFDESPSTITTNPEYITYILKPGQINSVALLELDASEIAINFYVDNSGTLSEEYFAYKNMADNSGVGNWYEYFYEPFYYQTSLATTDLLNASLLDLPQYSNTILCVTVRKAGSTASLGVLATGVVYELGKTQNGMSLSIIDYSKKDTDTYGNTVLVRRKFSKRVSATFFLYSSKVDVVSNLLTQYRATPVVWIGADAQYSSLVVYGFYRDWNIGIPNNIGSTCTIEIEGLT